MRKQTIFIILLLFLIPIFSYLLVVVFPYYKHSIGLEATLLEMDVYLASSILLSFSIVWVSLVIPLFMKKIFPKILDIRVIRSLLKALPSIAISSSILFVISLILAAKNSSTDAYYLGLGLEFINANIFEYPSTMESLEIIQVGEALSRSLMWYLMWGVTIFFPAFTAWYITKFECLFELDILD